VDPNTPLEYYLAGLYVTLLTFNASYGIHVIVMLLSMRKQSQWCVYAAAFDDVEDDRFGRADSFINSVLAADPNKFDSVRFTYTGRSPGKLRTSRRIKRAGKGPCSSSTGSLSEHILRD
jgi:hypothetical protein